MTARQVEALLTNQECRWWRVKIQSFKSKAHFLLYAGRYVRRPPIAQYRITALDARTVTFWYKDKKLHRRVYVKCSPEQFVERWGQHIPEPYQHGIRSFGLFGPREDAKASAYHVSLRLLAAIKSPPRRNQSSALRKQI